MRKSTLLLLIASLAVVPMTFASPVTRYTQIVLSQVDDAGTIVDAGTPSVTPVLPATIDGEVTDAVPFFKAIFDAVTAKNWVLAASFLVSTLVFLARWASKKWRFLPFLATDRGGVILTFAFSFSGGLSNALLAGGSVNTALLFQCVMVATYAIGGFVGLKKLLFPSDVA